MNSFIFTSWKLLRDVVVNSVITNKSELYLVSAFPDIVKDCPKMRNLPKKCHECWPWCSGVIEVMS